MAVSIRSSLCIANGKLVRPLLQNILTRSAYIGQPINDPPVHPRKYEVSRDPEEWKIVTKLLNKRTVPPFTRKPEYPSGWTPPAEKTPTHPYFVERNKNHMLSLYLLQEDRGQRKITIIKRIQGDIWMLHNELKQFIEDMQGKRISSQVLEINSSVKFKGDHYHWAEEWLLSKGF